MASNCTTPENPLEGAVKALPGEGGLFSGGPYAYRAYGLSFASEISFPQWPEATGAGEPDVRIGQGVIFGRDYVPPSSVQIESSPGELLLRGSQSATIRVSGGNAITVQQLPGGNPGIIRQILLGWSLAGIFHQRGMLPLHGSALCDGDACFVFCAASGTGKSTLAAAFLKGNEIGKAVSCLTEVLTLAPNYKDAPLLLARYRELNSNRNLQVFLMGATSEFATLCRKVVIQFFPKAKVKAQAKDVKAKANAIKVKAI